jgi:uncharacterized protein YjbI with pentapeptide repeats
MAAKPKPIGEPEPPELRPALERIQVDLFTRHTIWEDVELIDPDLALTEAHEPRLTGFRITGGDLGDSRISHLALDDAELLRCNAANLKATRARLRRVRFGEVRMTGIDLSETELHEVSLTDCRADYASFNRGRLESVLMENCVLREADFANARLIRVRFKNCDLSQADFGGAELQRCEMVGCTLEGVKGVPNLSGVSMPWDDIVAAAAVFAGALGIQQLGD